MATSNRKRRVGLLAAPAALLMALWITAPALGHHDPSHAGGPSTDQGNAGGQANGSKVTAEQDAAIAAGASATTECGEYCSTFDGSPSANGNGNSGTNHAAGSVGSADNKNPLGQATNGGDSNNGYECDGNSGIARGNPAHTACSPPPPPPGPPPPPPPGPPPPPPPGPPPPPAVGVLGEVETKRPPAEVAPVEGEELAFTGMTSAPLALAALGLAAIGGILILAGRRRTSRP